MEKEELQQILDKHKKWLKNEEGGERANLTGAYLTGANLACADLTGARNIPDVVAAETSILPDGDLIGWKKLSGGLICKLLIAHDVPRSNATGRKCRCQSAKVLAIYDGGEEVPEGVALYSSEFIYRVGETVAVDDFDNDRWNECSHGIHFFITRYEAEHY